MKKAVMRNQSSAEIGQALGLAPATVQKYARDRRIPFDTTPGGHRRFDLAEVRAALYGTSPSLADEPLPLDGSLGTGASISYGAAAAAERDTRALVALPTDEAPVGRTALQELFGHARRVLVSTSR